MLVAIPPILPALTLVQSPSWPPSEEQQSTSSLGHIDHAHHFQTLIRPDLKQPLRRALSLIHMQSIRPEGRLSHMGRLHCHLLMSHKSLESQINQETPLSFLK